MKKRFSTEDFLLIKTFWAGKTIQELHLPTEDELTHQHPLTQSPPDDDQSQAQLISDALHCLTLSETSLSQRVHDILMGSKDEHAIVSDQEPLLSDGTLDWSKTSDYFDANAIESGDLTGGARCCRILAGQVSRQVSKDEKLVSELANLSNYAWTAHPEVFSECVDGLAGRVDPKLRINATILLCTAALERALGDVFLSVSKNKRCPYLLRDLLATQELAGTFSAHAMFVLRCLIGPPTGLNLRNILWHGFADCNEIPSQFCTLLLVMVASLGKMLSSLSSPVAIVHRPLVTFPQEPLLSTVFNDVTPALCQRMERLFSQNYFILQSMLPTWQAALRAFQSENYGMCVCLLLPSLEHSLRRVFACVNQCPNRAVTAEADTLYTTFDEILSPVLEDGQPNHIIEELGKAKMEMLLDLLVHPEGLRLRDKISHGEVAFFGLSRRLANHVLCVAVLFCIKYSLTKYFNSELGLVDCVAAESRYVSLFHPLSLLRRELEELHDNICQWEKIPVAPQWRETPGKHLECEGATLCQTLHDLIHEMLGSSFPLSPSSGRRIKEVIAQVWASPPETLFVPRQHLELAGLMRRTISHTTAAVSQVRETAEARHLQHSRQELRSRQRANYGVLTSSLPLYRECVEVVMLLSVLTTSRLKTADPNHVSKNIKFHKKVLQFSENFRSLSSPSQNRWEDANTLCNSTATLIQQHATSLQHHCMPLSAM